MKKKVVVTGLGTVNPLANNIADTWQAIKDGRSGITLNDRFDTTSYVTKIAGLVKNFNPGDYMDRREARKMCRFTQYAVAAANEAMAQAGIKKGDIEPARGGVILGNGIGGQDTLQTAYKKLDENLPHRLQPLTIPKLISNEAAANVAISYDLRGPVYIITTACASGTDALGHAKLLIETGKIDLAVSGGAEAALTGLGIAGFNVISALSVKRNDDPEKACRPFDSDRDGFVHSEGAGVMVLESEEHAKARGAKILGRLAGYGMTCDADHLTAPHPEGRGAISAMRQALEDAELQPQDIDYINAHGTSTPINDPMETKAIKTVFGPHAQNLKVSSTKSMHGHLIGAAGGLEAVVTVAAMQSNYYPATINLENPDPECDLDYVPNQGAEGNIRAAMSNSFGFGGHNGVVLFTGA